MLRRLIWISTAGVVMMWATVTQAADRPPGAQLLPDDTLLYVRIPDVPEFRERFAETAMGRIGRDPQMQPLVGRFYDSLNELYQRIEERIGLPLDKLLSIPQGEVWFAVVAPETGSPQVALLVDAGDRIADARQVIDHLGQQVVAANGTKEEETVGDVRLQVLRGANRRNGAVIFEKDSAVVVSSDPLLSKQLLSVWMGTESPPTLANNSRYQTVLRYCRGTAGAPVHIEFYANPIDLLSRARRGDLSVQATLALMSGLGLDGLHAIGASASLATDEYDSVLHAHALLASPRAGILKMITLKPGDMTPEDWVPPDVQAYRTLHWDFAKTYAELQHLFDVFRGENAWQTQVVDRFAQQTGLDLQRDIVDALEGRVTHANWMEPPARINSQSTLIGIKLNDAPQTRQTLEKLLERFPGRFEEVPFANTTYWKGQPRNIPGRNAETMRRPQPCLLILGDYLLFADSPKLLEEAIVTKSDASKSLANELDYKLIANKIERLAGATRPGMVVFQRPEESLRNLYEMASSEQTRSRVRQNAESNPLFGLLNNTLGDDPLPPFAVLAQYLAPGGAMVTNDANGVHYMTFTLKRD